MDAYVFAFAHLKGGVGKTALTLHMADALFLAGRRVEVVDLDPQGTATQWAGVQASAGLDGPRVGQIDDGAVARDVPRIAGSNDFVLIDCPPRLGRATRKAMSVADLVVIPVTPGPEAVWALAETMTALDEVRAVRPDLPAVAVLNQEQRTGMATVTRHALSGASVAMVPETLGHRVAFVEAIAAGQGVRRYAPSSKAAAELEALVGRLLDIAATGNIPAIVEDARE